MGEILDTMIKALEARMDSGVLHDLSATRLHMLIGKELVNNALNLPDNDAVISIIEKAMQAYFSPPEEEFLEEPEEPKVEEKESPASGPVKFKLNVAQNKENNHTFINKVPVIFSPVSLKQSLLELLHSTVDPENPGYVNELNENISFENSKNMMNDIFSSLTGLSETQKIKLGLVVFKLLGFGEVHGNKMINGWEFKVLNPEYSEKSFLLGFIKAVFSCVYHEKYAIFEFTLNELGDSIEVRG